MKASKNKSKNEIKIEGEVVIQAFGKGSKSQHEAICLKTKEETYKLRRMDGNPFHDPALVKLVGKQIVAEGFLQDYLFIATSLEEMDDDKKKKHEEKEKKGKKKDDC